jgi:6-phosphogluconolactonase
MGDLGMKNNNEHLFLEQKELIDTLSLNIIANLKEAILNKGKASLIVSGGSTPKPLFEKLSSFDIPWEKVKIALCDERWISTNNKDSNEKLVKDSLLVNFAEKAQFISMYQENIDIEDAQGLCSDIYKKELFPFDVLILGMGNDGHTASLFPNNIKLKEAFEINNRLCIWMEPKDAPHKRMSLTKKAILSANNIYLHFEGIEKQNIYKKILEGADRYDMPIAAILNQDKKIIEVYYK